RLGPQMALHLALMLHELGTNAIKHGALSRPQGQVTINWTVDQSMLRLRWVERGGPPARAPNTLGFGMILIEQSAKSEGGEARLSLDADGIAWEITLPLPRLQTDRSAGIARSGVPSSQETRVVEKAAARLAGKRLLVVEDEPLVALDMVGCLEEAGAETATTIGTVTEALQTIESASF